MADTPRVPRTCDGRYIVVRGRLWRASNPHLPADVRQHWVNKLMVARRAQARADVQQAKEALGERGPVWWDDGAPDYNRRLAKNTPYAQWAQTQASCAGHGRPLEPKAREQPVGRAERRPPLRGAPMAATLDSSLLQPPKAVRDACQQGIDLHGEYGGKGLRETTVNWARHFAAGEANEPAQARRMRAWLHRHRVDKRDGWDSPPTPGFVAWQLWGGDDAVSWVERICDAAEAAGVDSGPSKKAAGKTPGRLAKAATKRGKTGGRKKKAGSKKKAASKKKAGSKKKASSKQPPRGAKKKKSGKKKVAGTKKAAGKKKTTARKKATSARRK